MARGGGNTQGLPAADIDTGMDLFGQADTGLTDDLFAGALPTAASPEKGRPRPDVWTPGELDMQEAEQFYNLFSVDQHVALPILKTAQGDFDAAYNFFYPKRHLLIDPDRTMPGMKAAGETIHQALVDGKKIAIFGDYDPDGTTGTEALRRAVIAHAGHKSQIIVEQADANDGFGLTHDFVQRMHQAGVSIIITVDCGSGQDEQVSYAHELGMKVVVVDHHSTNDKNPADFHLNPNLPGIKNEGKNLTGSPLAWKLGLAVHQASGEVPDDYYCQPLFLAGMGLQADRGTLATLENRAFIRSPQNEFSERAVPIGLVTAAEVLAEVADIDDYVLDPNNRMRIMAFLNTSKRYSKASADDVVKLLGCTTRAQAMKIVPRMVKNYLLVVEERKLMAEKMMADFEAPFKLRDELEERLTKGEDKLAKAKASVKAFRAELKAANEAHKEVSGADISDGKKAELLAQIEPKRAQSKAAVSAAVEKADKIADKIAKIHEQIAPVEAAIEAHQYSASSLLHGHEHFFGCAGLMAPALTRTTGLPSIVGVVMEPRTLTTPDGETVTQTRVKFRIAIPDAVERNALYEEKQEADGRGVATRWRKLRPLPLKDDELMRAACTLKQLDAAGNIIEEASLGGHPALLSGTCLVENWPEVEARWNDFCTEKAGKRGTGWIVPSRQVRHDTYINNIEPVSAKQYLRIKDQATQAGPYEWNSGYRPGSVSAIGVLEKVWVDDRGYTRALLLLDDKRTREEVLISRMAKPELPEVGEERIWVLPMDGSRDPVTKFWW